MKRKLPIFLSFFAIFFLMAIGLDSQATGGQTSVYLPLVVSKLPPIIPDTTKVLPASTTQYLSDISPDGSVFTFSQSTPDLQVLAPDDIIVSDVTAAAPYGFLRKVSSVSDSGGQVVVNTVSTTLEDAIQQGSMNYSTQLTPANIVSMTTQPGVTLLNGDSPTIDDSFYFEIEDVVLYDEDGNLNTTNDQLKANGSLELAPGFDFDWTIQDWTLQDLEFVFNVEETTELEFEVEVNVINLELSYEIARLNLGTVTVFVGLVPVVFFIEMPIYLKGDGEVSVGIVTRVTQEATLSAGLHYEQGDWSPIANLTNNFDWLPPTLFAGAEFKGYIDPPLGLLLYGVTGPFAAVTPYLELEADTSADPWWELYGGINATIGVKVEVLGHSLGDHTEVVLAYRLLVVHASGGFGADSWQEVGADSANGGGISNTPGGYVWRPSLAIASDGASYVAWGDNSSGNGEIYVRAWNGNSWAEVGIGSASGGGISNSAGYSTYPSLAVALNSKPYVAWRNDSVGDAEIYVLAWNGSSWAEVGVGSASNGGISNNAGTSSVPSLAIAPDGTPYVAWSDYSIGVSEIYVRVWNGSGWAEVGAGSASGGGVSNSAGDSGLPSIAIAPNGTPYVVWYDDSSGDSEIYIRVWNGSNWVEVGPGSASGEGISNNDGDSGSPSLAIAPDGTPYVAWYDFSSGDMEIYVRAWNGSNWVEVGVGSASGGGISNNDGHSTSPSLAVSPDGMPYVAWQNYSSGSFEIYVRAWNGSSWAEVGVGSASGGGISNNVGYSGYPSFAIALDGTPYLAWDDDSIGNFEIYIRRYIE